MGANGTTTALSFGSLTAAPAGAKSGPAQRASTTITGQSGIVSGSSVEAWLRAQPAGTSDHSQGEHIALAEDLFIEACNIVAGVGFDIVAKHLKGGCYGAVAIDWVWY